MNERERIEYIMNCSGLSSSQFADKTGIPRASVSHILGGRNKPSLEVLQKVATAFPDVDLQWLMLGVGEKPILKQDAKEHLDTVSSNNATLFSVDIIDDNTISAQNEVAVKQVVRNTPIDVVKSKISARNAQTDRQVRRLRQPQQEESLRRIKEIRVFYNDGTFEILFPEK